MHGRFNHTYLLFISIALPGLEFRREASCLNWQTATYKNGKFVLKVELWEYSLV